MWNEIWFPAGLPVGKRTKVAAMTAFWLLPVFLLHHVSHISRILLLSIFFSATETIFISENSFLGGLSNFQGYVTFFVKPRRLQGKLTGGHPK